MTKTLDILIVSIVSRAATFGHQLQRLEKQIARWNGRVGVLYKIDNGESTIAAKRNALVKESDARYVVFVDDDDFLADDYVESIMSEILGSPDCVCIGMKVLMANGVWQTNDFSIRHKKKHHEGPLDDDSARLYCCPPGHMCAIKREIMLQFPFDETMIRGEDTEQALDMARAGALKTERKVDHPIYFYTPSWLQQWFGVPAMSRPR